MSAKKIFVLGSARSGTSLVHKLICGGDNVVGAIETEFFKKWSHFDGNKQKLLNNLPWSELEREILRKAFSATSNAMEVFCAYLDGVAKEYSKEYVVEKSPVHTMLIGKLLKEGLVVYVHRDLREIAISRLRSPRISRGSKGIFKRIKFVQLILNYSEGYFLENEIRKFSHKCHVIDYNNLDKHSEINGLSIFLGFKVPSRIENIVDIRFGKKQTTMYKTNSSFGHHNGETISIKPTEFYESNVSNLEWWILTQLNSRKGLLFKVFVMFSTIDKFFFLRKNGLSPFV